MAKVGFIYKITDNTNGNKYYGSTTQSVSQRMTGHRGNYKRGDDRGKGCVSLQILKNEDWRYETVEKFMHDEKFELRNREQHYIDNNECINKTRAVRSPEYTQQYYKEYYQKNIEQRRIINKKSAEKYYIKNKDTRNAKATCECGAIITLNNMSKHKKTKKHQSFIK